MIVLIASLKSKVQRIQDLRRSNAAQPVRNKKKYTRKIKHKRRVDLTDWSAARNSVGASMRLSQAPKLPEICEFYHKNKLNKLGSVA